MPSYTVARPSWFSSALELREGGSIVGDIKILKKWSYALAEGKMGGRTVRFGYKGWGMQGTFISDASDTVLATARTLSWWKGDVELVLNGKTYLWKQTDWWGSTFAWYDGDKEVISYRSRWGMKHFADVQIEHTPDETETTLLLFGLYLLTLYQMNMGASSVV